MKAPIIGMKRLTRGIEIMNIKKLATIAAVCSYVCVAFSASVEAGEFERVDSSMVLESWLPEDGVGIPVLSFESTIEQVGFSEDFRAENLIREKNGSTRSQVSYQGPLGRQVFANVRSIERGDGYARNIITSIADGSQREFLSRTDERHAFSKTDKAVENIPIPGLEQTDDNDTECVSCALIIATSLACIVGEKRAYQQCYENCQSQGGIKSFEGGTCGIYSIECTCFTQPPVTAIEF